MHRLINADCLSYLKDSNETWTTIFADPPDNIGLGYDSYEDRLPDEKYVQLLRDWLECFVWKAKTVWFSFNARWMFEIGPIVKHIVGRHCGDVEAKAYVQVFTFGQHSHHDLGNNHRPLIRLRWHDAPLLPDAVRVPSWRQLNGDKRADPRGRVPGDVFDMQYPGLPANRIGAWLSAALDDPSVCEEMKSDIRQWFETCPGDVFDFPRVTGNSAQRCNWHPTQLHENLVERCIKLSTPLCDSVLDPFGGTGTTLRVCKRLDFPSTTIELDPTYCKNIAEENGLRCSREGHWCSL